MTLVEQETELYFEKYYARRSVFEYHQQLQLTLGFHY